MSHCVHKKSPDVDLTGGSSRPRLGARDKIDHKINKRIDVVIILHPVDIKPAQSDSTAKHLNTNEIFGSCQV